MSPQVIIGYVASYVLFLPILIILLFKLYTNPSLLVVSIYYLITAIFNLMQNGTIPVSADVQRVIGVIINYVDAPLMLIVMLFFCSTKWMKHTIYISLTAFITYEIVIGAIYGLTVTSSVYVLGPGIGLMLIYSSYLFFKHIRFTIVFGKFIGRSLMLMAIMFSYIFFAMIYFFYYIQKTPAVADVFLIYFIVSIISCLLMSAGLFWIHKRLKQLKEVQLTRKELVMFFNN